ncbi:MAG: NADH:ubiquinone oxidoreductase [Bacillota bacterium]
MKRRPRVGIFSFTSCEGCQLQIVNIMEEHLLDVVDAIELVTFREAMDPAGKDYDIAFVEGAITRESEIPVLKEIRKKADTLVAMGACATTGGVNAMKNALSPEENLRAVYGDSAQYYDTIEARALDEVVEVDYYIRSCPMDRSEFIQVVTSILMGREPYDPNFAVCVECQMRGNPCVYDLDTDEICLGPVTRAGCGALCPGFGSACIGCRGFIEQANFDAMIEIMKAHGMDEEEAEKRLRVFNARRRKVQ